MKTESKMRKRNRNNGAQQGSKRIHFEFASPTAEQVAIAGSFNDWQPNATPMIARGDGRWAKQLVLRPGVYEYRFLVDGRWVSDPFNSETAPNPFGEVNSVVRVTIQLNGVSESPLPKTKTKNQAQSEEDAMQQSLWRKNARMHALLAPTRERGASRDASVRRILLVDDEIGVWWNPQIAALAAAGYDVDTAENGEAGWNALRNKDYDLLITDNKMPKLWGMELIKKLREHGSTLPIIFTSSFLPVIDRGEQHYFRGVGMLEKPVTPSQLLAIVEKSWTKQERRTPVNEAARLPEAFRPFQLVQGRHQ
ncbi:MAG: response regulator [Limisphaerales bacterium]